MFDALGPGAGQLTGTDPWGSSGAAEWQKSCLLNLWELSSGRGCTVVELLKRPSETGTDAVQSHQAVSEVSLLAVSPKLHKLVFALGACFPGCLTTYKP